MKLDAKMMEEVEELIERALKEDIGDGDLTTEIVLHEPRFSKASIVSKEDGVLAGIEIAESVFRSIDDTLEIESYLEDGERFENEAVLMRIKGNGSSMLTAERCALNFLGRLSGIASYTDKFVKAVENTDAVILDTRKTTPTLRSIEKYAVRAGGGSNHRMGLFDHILVKDNHAIWAGGVSKAVSNVLRAIGKDRGLIEVIVEVKKREEVKEAMVRGVDRILLDNMTPEEVKEIRIDVPASWKIEVSGGVNLENVRAFAEAGVDFISIGALTHSPKTIDLSMLMDEV